MRTNLVRSIIGLCAFTAIHTNAEFKAAVFHSSEFTNNADLSDTDEPSEREDRTGLEVEYTHQAQNWLFNFDYQFEKVNFDSNAQIPEEDTEEYEGTTGFDGLFFRQRLGLRTSYRRENLLTDPAELSVQNNITARDTFVFEPTLNFYRNDADNLSLTGFFHKIRFDDDFLQTRSIGSETKGLRLGWTRKVSSVDNFIAQIENSETEYDQNGVDTLDYQNIQLGYAAQLRKLNYTVLVGYNRSSSASTQDLESPSALIQALYQSGPTQINFFANYLITDTSRGNQNGITGSLSESNNQQLGNGDTSIIDSYELLSGQLKVSNRWCRRCLAEFEVGFADEDYSVDDTESLQQLDISGSLGYELTSKLSVEFEVGYQTQSREIPQPTLEYDEDIYILSAEYYHSEKLSTGVSALYRDRDAEDDTRSYQEASLTLDIRYEFWPKRGCIQRMFAYSRIC